MGSWLAKTAVQRVFSGLPRSEWWNGLMQRYVTGGLRLQPYGEFQAKLKACQQHFQYYQTYSRQPRDNFSTVEIGTGWFPIIPVGLYLCGAGEILTYDIVRLLEPDTFARMVECFCLLESTGELYEFLPGARRERVANFVRLASSAGGLSPVEFLSRLNIHAIIGDVCDLPLRSGSVDLVFSNGVLEHLQPALLARAMAEARRICGWASVMSHFNVTCDQFADYDRSITHFNYLRYSERAWRWLDSPMIPQNRFRVSDYIRTYTEAGFEIVARKDINGAEADLARVAVAPEFTSYPREELLVLFSWLITRPAATAGEKA